MHAARFRLLPSCLAAILTFGVGLGASSTIFGAEAPVQFSLEIRPILSEKCFFCHGPDEKHREAKLRLDLEAPAKAIRDGKAPITPGDLAKSEVWKRIVTDDPEDLMPPPKSHRTLDAAQKSLIKRWIEQGATWGKHWSFEPLRPVTVPEAKAGAAQPIDLLVEQKLEPMGLKLAPRADWRILARRASLDLIGLPPTVEEADALAAAAERDPAGAWDKYVDHLLESPHFGEHWARMWLDLARYADTRGYEKDLMRDMWLYRDWVIKALNADMPFDKFTVEQLAGDLLPNATNDDLIATGFHRNTMTNDEGGTDDEEFRVAAVKDRVDTTLQVWMGLTAGCAKCHSHKYDPITQDDYYRFYAIFNQTQDADKSDDSPRLSLPTPEQAREQDALNAALKAAQQKLAVARKNDPKASKNNNPAPEDSAEVATAKKELIAATGHVRAQKDAILTTLIMRELNPKVHRVTHFQNRGNFLDPGPEVQAAVLPGFGDVPAGQSMNRLTAAQWLTSQENPLTPRVMANRIWARLFGLGLVETEEDFGSQGMLPSHPALLDWLALNYRDACGWSLKKFLKTVVLSRTYQQAYVMDARRQELDSRNVWLSRGPRFRLTAEMVRDQALAVSGLLSAKIGGRSVMPPQPDGLWKSTYSAAKWVTAAGEDRYRRGLYTFWKRTTPYPSMITFDAGSREVCQVRRVHTNTPLQALVLMNDPVYLEASAALAQRMMQASTDDAGRAREGLRRALIREVSAEEVQVVVAAYQDALEDFKAHPGAAEAFLKQADAHPIAEVAVESYAAWTTAASVVLNLDEVVMR